MKSHPAHDIARETLLELGRAGTAIESVAVSSDDGLAVQTKIGGDVRILQMVWLGVENAQLKPGRWRPRSTARP